MQNLFSHVITQEELDTFPHVFVDGAQAGDTTLLKANDLAVLGITQHVVTEEDIENNPGVDLTLGQTVNVPESDAFSSVEAEIAENAEEDIDVSDDEVLEVLTDSVE